MHWHHLMIVESVRTHVPLNRFLSQAWKLFLDYFT